jgi:hypothetical protein
MLNNFNFNKGFGKFIPDFFKFQNQNLDSYFNNIYY